MRRKGRVKNRTEGRMEEKGGEGRGGKKGRDEREGGGVHKAIVVREVKGTGRLRNSKRNRPQKFRRKRFPMPHGGVVDNDSI